MAHVSQLSWTAARLMVGAARCALRMMAEDTEETTQTLVLTLGMFGPLKRLPTRLINLSVLATVRPTVVGGVVYGS